MKWAMSLVGLVTAGLCGVVIIFLFQNITVGNEQEYYLLKEVTEASMLESIDLAYYRDTGEVKMMQEKFVENFVRRFAASANTAGIKDYSLSFYDIMEKPPKVSVVLKASLGRYTVYRQTNAFSIKNQLDAILEADDSKINIKSFENCKKYTGVYYSVITATDTSDNRYLNKLTDTGRSPVVHKLPKIIRDLYPNTSYDEYKNDYKIVEYNYLRKIITKRDALYYFNETNYNNMYDLSDSTYKPPNFAQETSKIQSAGNANTLIAQRFEFDKFYFNNEKDNFKKIGWKGRFKCSSENKTCSFGIIYELTWQNKKCTEEIKEGDD